MATTVNSERFEIIRRIGEGGMGVVFEAHDRMRDARVALKTLPELKPQSLSRFKHEFRSLVNISHPNLVTLYELFVEQDACFFTMEFIEGQDFLSALRPPSSEIPAPAASEPVDTPTLEMPPSQSGDSSPSGRSETWFAGGYDIDRLRPTLRQLAEGLNTLHQAGKLHRDIKPSNIIVSKEGRTVILDFGLVSELDDLFAAARAPVWAGTLPYMSPEQLQGRPLTPASDWYALGIVLFEALTGRRPFEGVTGETMAPERNTEAPKASEVGVDVPQDLEELCAALLRSDPSERPSGSDILTMLRDAPMAARSKPPKASTFVGREDALSELEAALAQTAAGKASIVLLSGASGLGKSRLVRHFLDLAAKEDTLTLAGRCYEQEVVPYRAVDNALDSLANFLAGFKEAEIQRLAPRNAWALAHLFPVLNLFPSEAAEGASTTADPFELRRLAFQSLRDLLTNLCGGVRAEAGTEASAGRRAFQNRRRVIIHLDDLQWGDADGAVLLAEVMRPPLAPPLLLIASFRDEQLEKNVFLRQLFAFAKQPGLVCREIKLEPLSAVESAILAERLLTESNSGTSSVAAVARESGGNPFFLFSLATSLKEGAALRKPDERATGPVVLDDLLWQRAQMLPDDARSLLEAVAVAGSPIAQICAFRAAGLSGRDPKVTAILRNGLLARSAGTAAADEIDTYHDRIRESLVARLPEETRRTYHVRLAAALVEFGSDDADRLAYHYEFAGVRAKAGRYYLEAAVRATQVLAFDKAAALYAKALELGDWTPLERHEMRVSLGSSLADAGRGLAAARVFEEESREARAEEQEQLERRAAFHYCASGYVEEGHAVSERVLGRYGIILPRTRLVSSLTLLGGHLRLRMRGLRFRERSEAEVPRRLLARIDAALEIGEGLGMVEVVPAMSVHLHGILSALKAGEPRRIAATAAIVACQMSASKKAERDGHYKPLIALSRAIAERTGDPLLDGYCGLSDAVTNLNQGRYRELYESCQRAERRFLECRGVAWHLWTIRTFRLFALMNLGRYRELWLSSEQVLREATEHGDLYTSTSVATHPLPVSLIVRHRPEEARQMAAEALARWTSRRHTMQHMFTQWTFTYADLFTGDWRRGLGDSESFLIFLRKTLMNQVNNTRVYAFDARARAALAAALSGGERKKHLSIAKGFIRRLESEYWPVPHAMAKAMRAAVADLEGRPEETLRLLREALAQFEQLGMAGFSNAVKLRLSTRVAGDEGRELRRQVEQWAAEEEVPDSGRLTLLFSSGFKEDRT
jgi:eukaryotic-like serine/threonine-protein kinase